MRYVVQLHISVSAVNFFNSLGSTSTQHSISLAYIKRMRTWMLWTLCSIYQGKHRSHKWISRPVGDGSLGCQRWSWRRRQALQKLWMRWMQTCNILVEQAWLLRLHSTALWLPKRKEVLLISKGLLLCKLLGIWFARLGPLTRAVDWYVFTLSPFQVCGHSP